MTGWQEPAARDAVEAWLRSSFEAKLAGIEPALTDGDWERLTSADAQAAKLLLNALEQPSDEAGEAAAAACAAASWPGALSLARCAAGLPTLLAAERRRGDDPRRLRQELAAEQDYLLNKKSPTRSPRGEMEALLHTLRLTERITSAQREHETPPAEQAADRERSAERLEALLAVARESRIAGLERRAAIALLDELAAAMALSCRAGCWQAAACCRGRYLGWWHAYAGFPGLQPGDTASLGPTLGTCRMIGKTVGAMHAIPSVHGTLLFESFTDSGAVKNFARTEFLPAPDIEAFVQDLRSLRHQMSPPQWHAFSSGYVESGGPMALTTLQRLAQEGTAEVAEVTKFPVTPLDQPHLVVRLCGHALRRLPAPPFDFRPRLEAAGRIAAPAQRARQAVDLLLESSGLDGEAVRDSGRLLLAAVAALRSRAPQEAAEVCRDALARTGPVLTATQRAVLTAWGEIAQADLASGGDEPAGHLLRAARALLSKLSSGTIRGAERLLAAALEKAESPAVRGEALAALLRVLIDRALREEDQAPLAAALDLRPEAKPLPSPSREAAMAYLLCAEALTAPDPGPPQDLLRRTLGERGSLPETEDLLRLIQRKAPRHDDDEDGALPEAELPPELRRS